MNKAGTNKGKPDSFEEALRKKLEAVDAAPKNAQWERLEAGLDLYDFKKRDRKQYFAIAATLLFLLISGGLLLFNNVDYSGTAKFSVTKENSTELVYQSEKPIGRISKRPEIISKTKPKKSVSKTADPFKKDSASGNNLAKATIPKENNTTILQPVKTSKPGIFKKPVTGIISIASNAVEKTRTIEKSGVSKLRKYNGTFAGKLKQAKSNALPAAISITNSGNQTLVASNKTASETKIASGKIGKENTAPNEIAASANLARKPAQEPVLLETTDTKNATAAEKKLLQPTINAQNSAQKNGNDKTSEIALAGTSKNNSIPAETIKPENKNQKSELNPGDKMLPVLVLETVPDSVKNGLQNTVALTNAGTDSTGLQNPVKKIIQNPFSFSVYAGRAFFNQNIKLSEPDKARMDKLGADPLFKPAADEFTHNTHPQFSFKTGILVGKQVAKGFIIESGIGFSHLTAATTSRFMVADVSEVSLSGLTAYENIRPVLTASLEPEENTLNSQVISATQYTVEYKYKYLQIPVRLQAYHDVQKWRVFASAGLEAGRLLQNNIKTENATAMQMAPDNSANPSKYFRKWLWSGIFSGGIGYRLTNDLILYGSGEINTYFSPVTSENTIRSIQQAPPKSVQLLVGLTYSLSRN